MTVLSTFRRERRHAKGEVPVLVGLEGDESGLSPRRFDEWGKRWGTSTRLGRGLDAWCDVTPDAAALACRMKWRLGCMNTCICTSVQQLEIRCRSTYRGKVGATEYRYLFIERSSHQLAA